MAATIGSVLVVALALFLAFIALAYFAAAEAQRAQAVEDEELRELWPAAARGQAVPTAPGRPGVRSNPSPVARFANIRHARIRPLRLCPAERDRRYLSPSPPVLRGVTTKSTRRLPHCEQLSRLAHSGTARSAP